MKTILINVLLIISVMSYGQSFKTEMKKLEPLAGRWKGTASYKMGPGEPHRVEQSEIIEFKLDSAILQIEGLGTSGGRVAHHALAMVNFNIYESKFNFRSYLNDGKMSDAHFSVPAPGQYAWGFDSPQRKIRYLIVIENNTWKETGEYSTDGVQWIRFIEMNLTKQ
jgi:hypothetical protein